MLEIRHDNMDSTPAVLDAYNDIYGSIGIEHQDSFYLWLISLLKPEKGKLLIDISCGQGKLIALAQKMGIRSIGTDFAIKGLLIGKHYSQDAGWVVGDGEHLPFTDQCADYITHIGSLEHYIDPYQGAREIARILKPNGKACILLPNAFGIWGNIRHVWRTGEIFDDGQPLQRYATHQTWAKLLTEGNLEITKTLSYGEVVFPRTKSDGLYLLSRPRKILRLLINVLIPKNLANHLVFICQKGKTI
jgi:ubiquinone/menaquinone biosynthesis C-methylase UbiE